MSYRYQFYHEGLATTFYLKPIKFIKEKVKNKEKARKLCIAVKVLYTLLAIVFGIIMFIINFPL